MQHFPVSNSNLSAPHLAVFLQTQYNLPADTHCHLIKAGINDTYHVKAGADKYIFRVYSLNWRTKQEILEEIRLLCLLKEHKIPVSYPYTDIHDNYIQLLPAPEGERFGVLFSYATGEKLSFYPAPLHFKIGAIMAQLHQLTQGITLNRTTYTHKNLLEDPLTEIKQFLSADTEEMAFMTSAQQYLRKELINADTTQLRQGAVHMDIWFDNLNINKDNEVTIFDFDFCGNGWQCLDIAYYVLQLHSLIREETECKTKVDSFLAGYASVTPISGEEQRLIPILGVTLYFFYLGIQCKRYDNWSNSFLSESYLKRFINVLVKRYYELYQLGD